MSALPPVGATIEIIAGPLKGCRAVVERHAHMTGAGGEVEAVFFTVDSEMVRLCRRAGFCEGLDVGQFFAFAPHLVREVRQ